ncbi:MAG: hypothetical protein ACTSPB_00230 [Candidatus Thorarchaeota archaeon]
MEEKTKEERDKMSEYAHEQHDSDFWKGVKYALFWVQGSISDDVLKRSEDT